MVGLVNKNIYLPKLFYQITQLITFIIRLQFLNFKYNLSWEELTHLLDKKISFKMCRVVYQNKPTSRFYKINSDGSHKDNSSGGGGVIRDSQGKMIMAYSIHFEHGTLQKLKLYCLGSNGVFIITLQIWNWKLILVFSCLRSRMFLKFLGRLINLFEKLEDIWRVPLGLSIIATEKPTRWQIFLQL